jgi:hypothetical protein
MRPKQAAIGHRLSSDRRFAASEAGGHPEEFANRFPLDEESRLPKNSIPEIYLIAHGASESPCYLTEHNG